MRFKNLFGAPFWVLGSFNPMNFLPRPGRSYLALVLAFTSPLFSHPGHEGDPETAVGGASALPAPQVSITEEGGTIS